jgi:hypothetical protein
MNVEIGAEATLFPEKEYIDGIAVAVQVRSRYWKTEKNYKWQRIMRCVSIRRFIIIKYTHWSKRKLSINYQQQLAI